MKNDIEVLIKNYLESLGYLVRHVEIEDEMDDKKRIIDFISRIKIRIINDK